jgi:hypothetical protein
MMLKKALTVGATAILAILASAGVASASEVNAAQILPLPPIASHAEPESTTLPEPDEDDAKSEDADSKDADSKDGESKDTESNSESDNPDESKTDDSDGKTDESGGTTEPEEELEQVELPAPAEEEPAAGPLGLIQSLVTSLFG